MPKNKALVLDALRNSHPAPLTMTRVRDLIIEGGGGISGDMARKYLEALVSDGLATKTVTDGLDTYQFGKPLEDRGDKREDSPGVPPA
jgi:hypothetical protein